MAGVLFIISDDFILALLSYLFQFYFGFIVLFVGCFNKFCFICFLQVFIALAANQMSLRTMKLKLKLGAPDR